MNTQVLLDRVRSYDADVVLDGDRLVVRGAGDPLPAELMAALRAEKPALVELLRQPLASPPAVAEEVEACLRLGQRLARREIPFIVCGITGEPCRLCHGIPCLGSTSG